eukprot:TRINITY_DN3939_c0_g1_i1.p1 TRINITY_DN3939_c0_g1~~TRINITY_DN3939_c0_g1_i1.p1  ORF type:complete len:86 (-),score=12.47 TRINITY_DN3939_c0_g1_i1:216-473(-)
MSQHCHPTDSFGSNNMIQDDEIFDKFDEPKEYKVIPVPRSPVDHLMEQKCDNCGKFFYAFQAKIGRFFSGGFSGLGSTWVCAKYF